MRSQWWSTLALGLALVGSRTASATDYWDASTLNDNSSQTRNELVHGTSQQHDLEANPGPVADEDWYVFANHQDASYEAVIDSTAGDLVMNAPLTNFERLDAQGTTVLQTSELVSPGLIGSTSLALRWQNTAQDRGNLRVRSLLCGTNCGPEDRYNIRFYETTVAVPRFNNASGQVTVLIVQNPTSWIIIREIAGTVYFWSAAGTLLGSTTFSLAPKAALVLNTTTVPGVAGQGGTITIAHDGGYGNLAVKAVALEVATGFSFDSPGLYKPQ